MTLAYLSTPLVGLVNTAVIGRLGDAALIGGIAVGAIIFDIVFTTFNFLRSGTTGLAAQAHGARDRVELQAIFWRALILAFLAGGLVLLVHPLLLAVAAQWIGGSDAVHEATATYYGIRVLATPFALGNYVLLGWLIGFGRAGWTLVLQTLLNGMNVALSILLVEHGDLGVQGVGWAAFAAETTTFAVGMLLMLRLRDPEARPSLDRLRQWEPLRRMIAVNGDIMIQIGRAHV